MNLREATIKDIDDVMRIFSEARIAQRIAGFRQWEDDYPSFDLLESDIRESIGYILDYYGRNAGYIAIAGHDNEYDRHPELWDTSQSYSVFHRVALSDAYRGRKVSSILFELAEKRATESGSLFVRIDTGLENRPMQHILSKRGYSNLGYCKFIWGERYAYEKHL